MEPDVLDDWALIPAPEIEAEHDEEDDYGLIDIMLDEIEIFAV